MTQCFTKLPFFLKNTNDKDNHFNRCLYISALVWWFVPETDQHKKTDKSASLNRDKSTTSLKKLASEEISFHPFLLIKAFKEMDWSKLWDIFMVRFLIGFAVMLYRSNFVMVLDYKFQTSAKMNGYIISYTAIVSTLSGFLTGKVVKYYNSSDVRMLRHMGLIQCVMIIASTYAPNIPLLLLFMTPLGIANSIIRVVTTKVTIQRTSEHETGVLLGLGNSMMSIARMLAPSLGGLAGLLTLSGPGLLGSVSSIAGVIVLHIMERRSAAKTTKTE